MTHRNNAADIGRNILALNKCRRFARFGAAVLVGLVLTLAAAPACAQEPSPEWRPLIERLAAEGFDPGSLAALLGRGGVEYDPAAMTQKMEELYATKFGTRRTRSVQTHLARLGYLKDDVDGKLGPKTRHAIKLFQAAHGMAITGRADYALLDTLVRETRPMPPGTSVPEETDRQVVYSSVLTEERLAEARAFLAAHRATLHEVQSRYGVPAEIAVGIVTVETRCGLYLGEKSAFATLASMAASRDMAILEDMIQREQPTAEARRWLGNRMRQKADWALEELSAMLRYAGMNKLDPLRMPGSVYGAIGVCQFMPSSALKYGVDGDADGDVDLFTTEDALMSLGHFLSEHGWKREAISVSEQRKALYRYNHSTIYVNTVLAVARHLRGGATNK